MKKLLILAYDFPPYVSVGALRPYAWYKYLKEYDIYPIVVTRQWGNAYGDERDYIASGESSETIVEETEYGTLIRTPYKPNMANRLMLKYGKNQFAILRKAISAFYEFAQYIWNIGPKSCVYRGAKQYLKTHKADAIIATGEPFILFKYASALSEQYHIPWVADYRDPWIQSSRGNKWYKRLYYKYFEQKYMYNVTAITTVSTFFKDNISSLLQDKKYYIVANGYDYDNAKNIYGIKQGDDKLRIAFAGSIYKWHPIQSVLEEFMYFIQSHSNINLELNFYGVVNRTEKDVFTMWPLLQPYIKIHPKLSNAKLLSHLAYNNVLLLFNDYSIMGSKIYDYIATKRLILLCYSNDEDANILRNKFYANDIKNSTNRLQEKLIKETSSGIIVENKKALRALLNKLYDEYCNNKYIACNSHNIEKYSRKEQTGKLAEIIKDISHEC